MIKLFNRAKKKIKRNLQYVFTDSLGANYYQFVDPDSMSVERRFKLEEYLQMLSYRLSKDELQKFVDSILACADKKDINTIVFLTKELEARQKELMHPSLIFDVAAIQYIREDENEKVFDIAIHEQKVKQFEADAGGSLHDFFFHQSLRDYLPGLPLSSQDTMEYLGKMKLKYKQMNEVLASITGKRK